jgi:plastocyanin
MKYSNVRTLAAALVLGLGLSLLAWPLPAAERAPVSHEVVIQDMQFTPAQLTIREGDEVVFVNKDDMGHAATSTDGGRTFDTGMIPPGGRSKPVRLTRPAGGGAIGYLCPPHPGMKGSIVVQD